MGEIVRTAILLVIFVILAVGSFTNVIRHRKENKEARLEKKAEKKKKREEKKARRRAK